MLRPPISSHIALRHLIEEKYNFDDVDVEAFQQLDSFSDRNYLFSGRLARIHTCDRFVLKVVNSEDSACSSLVDGIISSMMHAKTAGVNCPCLIPTRNGSSHVKVSLQALVEGDPPVEKSALEGHSASEVHFCVFIMTFIQGTQLFHLPKPDHVLYHFGVLAGRLNVAWKTFQHPGVNEREPSNWHLQKLPHLHHRLKHPCFMSSELTPLIEAGMRVYEKHVMSKTELLTWGVIHTDFHDMNVLCHNGDFENMCVVDFLDVSRGPYIFELAGAAIDAMKDRDVPMDGLHPLVKGYTAHNPLPREELDLLVYAVIGKLAQQILLSVSTAADDPKHKEYIMTDCDKAVKLLKHLLTNLE